MSQYPVDLGRGYFVYQDDEGYGFSQDSVLLANLADIGSKDKVLDLGCGSGVISILITVKKRALRTVGIEIRENAVRLARQSVAQNGLEDKIEIVSGDIKSISDYIEIGSFDKAICNPPYYEDRLKNSDGITCKSAKSDNDRRESREEVNGQLRDFVKAAAAALKFGGDFFVVYKAYRLCELFCVLRDYQLEPKKMTLIIPKPFAEADTVIVKARKGAKCGLRCSTLTVTDSSGNYTDSFKALYE